jgi:hypothetical protein
MYVSNVCTRSELILHHELFQLTRKTMGDEHALIFAVPVRVLCLCV